MMLIFHVNVKMVTRTHFGLRGPKTGDVARGLVRILWVEEGRGRVGAQLYVRRVRLPRLQAVLFFLNVNGDRHVFGWRGYTGPGYGSGSDTNFPGSESWRGARSRQDNRNLLVFGGATFSPGQERDAKKSFKALRKIL